jgi:putative tricarboxylic transport membrane protein
VTDGDGTRDGTADGTRGGVRAGPGAGPGGTTSAGPDAGAASGSRAGTRAGRAVGLALFALAASYGLEATRYAVAFAADPIGPRAAPWLLAGLLAVFGAALAWRPAPLPVLPTATGLARVGLATTITLAYALLLPWLGFVLATALAMAGLAALAGGPPRRAFATALAFTAALYYLFVFALGLDLPVGRVFPFLGG